MHVSNINTIIADIVNIGDIIADIDIANMYIAIFYLLMNVAQHIDFKYWHYL